MMNLYLLIGAGVVVAAMTGGAYFKGKAADRERSDLVILTMQNEAAARLANANAKSIATSTQLQSTKERAERDLQTERARGARRVADAVATAGIVRDELAAFASGADPSSDTVAAAVGRTEALGLVLGESLQLQNELAAAAEAESANVRALLKAWPVVPPSQ